MNSTTTPITKAESHTRGPVVRQEPLLVVPEGADDAGPLGTFVGSTKFGDPKTGREGFCLDIAQLDNPEAPLARIRLPFFAHGFAVHHRSPERAVLTEKQGPGGAVVDLAAQRVEQTIAPQSGYAFYGHGTFTGDGQEFLAVESALDGDARGAGRGLITVRDAQTLKIVDEFPTFGNAPHDCVLIEEGATLAVTNGGDGRGATDDDQRPSVAFIDVASRRLVERHVIPHESWNAGHLSLLPDREFAVVSAPRFGLEDTCPGGISLRTRGGALKSLNTPADVIARLTGEVLSVAIHPERRLVVAASPFGGAVTIWSFDDGTLLKTIELEMPRGVVLTQTGDHFLIAHGPRGQLLLLDAATLEPLSDNILQGASVCSGSHLYSWSFPTPTARPARSASLT